MKLKTLFEEGEPETADFISAYLNENGVGAFISDRFGLTKVVIPLSYSMKTGERITRVKDVHQGKVVNDNISILTYPDGHFKVSFLTDIIELTNSATFKHNENLHNPDSLPELLHVIRGMMHVWKTWEPNEA